MHHNMPFQSIKFHSPSLLPCRLRRLDPRAFGTCPTPVENS